MNPNPPLNNIEVIAPELSSKIGPRQSEILKIKSSLKILSKNIKITASARPDKINPNFPKFEYSYIKLAALTLPFKPFFA